MNGDRYVVDVEALKRDYSIDTSGTNYVEKRAIFDKLLFLDKREGVLKKLYAWSTITGEALHKMAESREQLSLERQVLLREAVALNMHLDMAIVHVRQPWDGKSERYQTVSFKDYVSGLLGQYAVQ